jgi:hypothetical protein
VGKAQSFERRLEQFVEGFFARTFRSGLQPVELGRRLVREMDRGKTLTNRGVVVANHFTVSLSPPDAERFSHFEDSLRAELVAGLTEQCGREGWHTLGPVQVIFETDDALKIGRYVIESRIVEAQPPAKRTAEQQEKATRRKPAGTPAAPAPAPSAAAAAVPDIDVDAEVELSDVPEPDVALDDDVTADPEPEVELEVEREAEPEVEAAPAPEDDYTFPMLVAHDGTEVEVYPGTMLLGRLEDCAVVFEDPNVSRHHAQIDSDERGWVVRDLGSTNGTFVNGKRISSPTRLSDGDRIAIGRNTLVYRA